MLHYYLELNSFDQLKLIAKYDGRKLTSFSNKLPFGWRRLVKLSEAYGSIEDDLLEMLEDLDECDLILLNRNNETPLKWTNKKIAKSELNFNVSKNTSVDISKTVVVNGEKQNDFVVLGNLFVACMATGELLMLESRGTWDLCDFCSQLEDHQDDDFNVIEDSKYSNPIQFFFNFDVVSDQFHQNQTAKVPIELFNQVQFMSTDLSSPVLNGITKMDGNLEVHVCPEPEHQSYMILILYNVNGKYYKPSCITFNKKFKEKFTSSFFGYAEDRNGTNQVLFDGTSFGCFEHDLELESVLFEKLIDVFTGRMIVLPNELGIRISKMDFHSRLPLFLESVSEYTFPFLMNDKPIYTKRMELSIEIDESQDEPNVKVSNLPVHTNFWMNIQEHMDSFESDNFVYFLTEENKKAFLQISKMVKELSEKDKDSRQEKMNFRMLDWFNLQSLGVSVKSDSKMFDIYNKVVNFDSVTLQDLPKNKGIKIRAYQRIGYSWLAFLHSLSFGAVLADDMGLGKTVQVLTFILAMKQRIVKPKLEKPIHLIVVPPSLLFNWEAEVNKLFPVLVVKTFFGQNRSTDFGDCDMVITTYDTLRIDHESLSPFTFESVIFDEAQFTKNLMSKRAQAVRKLNAHFMVCLTGTPLENSIFEYYAVVDLAIPGIFGTIEEFQKVISEKKEQLILNRAKPFVLRRTKTEILKELPKKSETDLWLNMSEAQKKLYSKIIKESRAVVAQESSNTMTILTSILRLRQICAAPELLKIAADKLTEKGLKKGETSEKAEKTLSVLNQLIKEAGDIESSPKVEFLETKIRELHLEGHSVLVYSQFRSMLDVLEPRLESKGLKYYRLDGSTPVMKRKKDVEDFQNSKEPATYLISLKAGGVGLNLTKASVVFFVEPWWNPAVENQAADRTHRIGQQKSVFVYRLLMKNSIEEKMMELKDKKKDLFKKILMFSLNESVDYRMKKEDLVFLLNE
ncbi:DEAD/DEAH box helicase [bacterium]|jgi:SNF2 family DNA or RNA helicase|nr:DEAD/DEAH box helicase [bacterium]